MRLLILIISSYKLSPNFFPMTTIAPYNICILLVFQVMIKPHNRSNSCCNYMANYSQVASVAEEIVEEGEGCFDLKVMGSGTPIGERFVVFGNPVVGQGRGVQALGGTPSEELGPGAAIGGKGGGGELTVGSGLEKAF